MCDLRSGSLKVAKSDRRSGENYFWMTFAPSNRWSRTRAHGPKDRRSIWRNFAIAAKTRGPALGHGWARCGPQAFLDAKAIKPTTVK